MSTTKNETTFGPVGLGTYVYDMVHGYYGRVTAVHLYCELPEDEDWVESQLPPIEDEAKQPAYLWYSALCKDGGAVVRPAYALRATEPFDLNNTWESKYFPKGGE